MSKKPEISLGNLRRASRIAAVQALYQMEIGGGAAEAVIAEFGAYRVGRSDPGVVPAALDQDLFADIVRGTTAGREATDSLIDDVLDKDRSLRRLEVLMRAILRAGAYELLEREDIDSALTIHEYVAVADAFFNEREPALVNAVLDRIARQLTEDPPPAEPIHGTAQDR